MYITNDNNATQTAQLEYANPPIPDIMRKTL